MNAKAETLAPADQLPRESPIRIPNESVEYRAARQALLAQGVELRRQIEPVAAMARSLPPLLVAGDDRKRPRPGPARRARPGPVVDRARYDARGARRGLVSLAGVPGLEPVPS